MEQEINAKKAARGSLSIAAIILSIVAISAAIACAIYIRCNDTNSQAKCGNKAEEQEQSVAAETLDITTARQKFADFIFYSGQDPELIAKNLFPNATFEYEIDEEGKRVLKTDIAYADFVESYNNYIDESIQTLKEKGSVEANPEYGYYDCDGNYCFNEGAGNTSRADTGYRGVIKDFKEVAGSKYEATVYSSLLNADGELINSQEEHYSIEFTQNDDGSYRFTKLEIE